MTRAAMTAVAPATAGHHAAISAGRPAKTAIARHAVKASAVPTAAEIARNMRAATMMSGRNVAPNRCPCPR